MIIDSNIQVERLKKKISSNKSIIFTGAGSGLSAKCQETGGSDGIIIFNSGKFRQSGKASLSAIMPYGNANKIVKNLTYEIVSVVSDTPVFCGVCCTDPTMDLNNYLRYLSKVGISGINNFPSVGILSGAIRENLEEVNISYGFEADIMLKAKKRGFLTLPYVFNENDATIMAEIGVDIIIIHLGSTSGGLSGVKSTKSINDCIEIINTISKKIKRINKDIIILCQGGPINDVTVAKNIFKNIEDVNGFCLASVAERLPVEESIIENINFYKSI